MGTLFLDDRVNLYPLCCKPVLLLQQYCHIGQAVP